MIARFVSSLPGEEPRVLLEVELVVPALPQRGAVLVLGEESFLVGGQRWALVDEEWDVTLTVTPILGAG